MQCYGLFSSYPCRRTFSIGVWLVIIIISCHASAEPIPGQCYLPPWGLSRSNEDPMGILSGYAPLTEILHHWGIQGWWWTPTCGSCHWSFLLLPLLYLRLPSPSLGGLFRFAGFLPYLREPHFFATAHLLSDWYTLSIYNFKLQEEITFLMTCFLTLPEDIKRCHLTKCTRHKTISSWPWLAKL